MRSQDMLHWLEEGGGRKLAAVVASLLVILLVVVFYGARRLVGPADENVLASLVVARSVADGHGMTTGVLQPQAVAVLEHQGVAWREEGGRLPELYRAPLYPWLLGTTLGLLPDSVAAKVWADPLPKGGGYPPRFGGDWAVLAWNLVLFLVLLGLVYLLGHGIGGARVGVVAVLGTTFAEGFWDGLLGLGGLVVPAILAVGLGLVALAFERERSVEAPRGARLLGFAAGAGALAGLLFLADYSAGWMLVPVLAWLGIRGTGARRALLPVVALVAAAVVAGPWIARNVALVGNPVGLAFQNLALKAGDPTAEPDEARSRLERALPELSHRKVIGKGLEAAEQTLGGGLWSGGTGLFLAFLVPAFFVRTRDGVVLGTRALLAGGGLFVALAAGFTSSGEPGLAPAAWLAPAWIVLGTGFLFVLVDSGQRQGWVRLGLVAAALVLHAAPLARGLAAPAEGNFRYPPYLPHTAALLRNERDNRMPQGGLMSDKPAGIAWYGATPAWNQPATYGDFLAIHLRQQELAFLLLTPARLDEPFFSGLANADRGASGAAGGWGEVYRGIARRQLPGFFPLAQLVPIGDNIFVLAHP